VPPIRLNSSNGLHSAIINVEIMLQPTVSRRVSLDVGLSSGALSQILITFRQLRVVDLGHPH
jgi:hypothetical protein